MSMDEEMSDFFNFEPPYPTQNQTETNAFSNSQFDFKLPVVDLDEQVEDLRRRAEIILEKLLVLPTPPKPKNSPPKPKVNQIIQDENIEKEEEIAPKATHIPTPNPSPKPSKPIKKKGKAKTTKTKKAKNPEYIIPKREPIVIPGANERYEQQLILLQQQLQRLHTENNKLQALIREYKMKLRESQIEEEKLKYTLQQSQKLRLNVNPNQHIKPI